MVLNIIIKVSFDKLLKILYKKTLFSPLYTHIQIILHFYFKTLLYSLYIVIIPITYIYNTTLNFF